MLAIGLILTLIPSHTLPMTRAGIAAISPEQKRAFAAKRAVFLKNTKQDAVIRPTLTPIPTVQTAAKNWYVYGTEGINNKIPVDENTLKLSKTIANMLEDLSGTSETEIPLTNFSIETIKNVFDILRSYDPNAKIQSSSFSNKIRHISFNQLINAIALLQWLDVSDDLLAIFSDQFTKQAPYHSDKNSTTAMLKGFNSDLQKTLIINPIVTYLKNEIVKQDMLYPTTLTGHQGAGINVEFSKDGKIAVTSAQGERDNVITWNAQTGQKLRTWTISEGDIEFININYDGSKILVVAIKNELNVPEFFNVPDTNKQDKQPKAPSKEIIILLDAKTGRQIKVLEDLPDTEVYEAEFSSDGQRIIAAIGHQLFIDDQNQQNEEEADLLIADSATGNIIATHKFKNNFANLTLNPQGTTVLVRSETDLILYDLTNGKEIKKLDGPTEKIYDAKYCADGTKIIGFDRQSHTVFIWNGKTGEQITQFTNITSSQVALNHNGTKMVTTDTQISVWDIATKTTFQIFDGGQNPVDSIQFSPDSSMIASAGQGNIILWDVATGKKLHVLDHSAHFIDVEFSSDGKRIMSHSSPPENETKCTVKLWNTSSGKEIHTFVAEHDLLEMDPRFLAVIGPDDNNKHNFVLWTSFSSQDRATFATMENNFDIDQIGTLYQLYMAKLNSMPLSNDVIVGVQNLPSDVQNMVNRYLKPSAMISKISLPQPQPLSQPASITTLPKERSPRPQPLSQPAATTPAAPKAKSWWEWVNSMSLGG